MLSLLTLILLLPRFNAQTTDSAHALDALLQDYAYRAFALPRTGIPYEGTVPSNLTGIKIAAMRLRSGSLRVRGVLMYREFVIPKGVLVHPYVERVVLVYQKFGQLVSEILSAAWLYLHCSSVGPSCLRCFKFICYEFV
ncbi:hypothetical protein OIU79_012574 [Salix purpurea]|uniref:Secreted protein n=1 Tax=Salix purpurea TaxID=77065 RepID=A0A9Q0Q3M0_SALPP|nr:hypothetical protein OIU79_012574 [Salix purpurea]